VRPKTAFLAVLITVPLAIAFAAAAIILNGSGTAPDRVERYGMVIGLKPDKIEYYKQLHAAAWPAVLAKIKECHIRNYSIYLREVEKGRYLLFSYFEYTGDDFEADMARMAADPETQRWWKETDPCQIPIATRGDKEFWSRMEEVFHLD
jgi:L-rhamnose mutarotase